MRFTPQDEEFRAASRLARRQPDRPVRRAARRGRPGPRARGVRRAAGLEPAPGRRGLDLPRLARRVRRARCHARPADDLLRGVRAGRRARPRVAIVGEELLGPTLIAFGTPSSKRRFLPPIAAGDELWCQGYSEPDAGSDLANVATTRRARRRRVGDHRPEGVDVARARGRLVLRALPDRARLAPQHRASRTCSSRCASRGSSPADRAAHRHVGVQRGLLRRRAHRAGNVVGEPGDGWRVAMGTLAFERGASTLGQQLGFARELRRAGRRSRGNGSGARPAAARAARRGPGSACEVMRFVRAATLPRASAASTGARPRCSKVLWARWHQRLGELAMDVLRRRVDRSPDGGADGTTWTLAAAVPVQPGRHHLRRLRRDPAQHHRQRALGLPRSASERTACSTARSVVITAAAGTGIGSAAARRCLEEGRRAWRSAISTSGGWPRPGDELAEAHAGLVRSPISATSPTRRRSQR